MMRGALPGARIAAPAGFGHSNTARPVQPRRRAACSAAAGWLAALRAYPTWPATAKVSLRTGAYISALGCCLAAWPRQLFDLAFPGR